jgi:hypothetical protein
MKPSAANTLPAPDRQTAGTAGRRILLLAPFLVLLGAALAGIWFKSSQTGAGWLLAGAGDIRLSDHTREQLGRLNAPVEIRFYSVLPPGSAPESLRDFSRHVDRLLSEFAGAQDRQLRVVRNLSAADTNAAAAAADGIRPFNLDKGAACFLGVTVASGGRKESLPQIQAEWGPALEFDLARLILKVAAAPSPAVARDITPIAPAITNEILSLIPNVPDTLPEDGIRILREAAFKEFTAAGVEMENQRKIAQQQLSDAQNGGSEAEQQAAMKNLQAVQLEQGAKYKEIAARLQVKLDVFRQMKTNAPGNSGP